VASGWWLVASGRKRKRKRKRRRKREKCY